MMKRITKILTGLLTAVIILIPASPAYAGFFNNAKDQACQGANLDGSGACDANAGNSLNNIIRNVVNILSVIVGIIAVVMIIVAGVKFVTSGGAAEKVTSAKNTVLYAVIGLIIVALAQIIVRFVLSKATK